MAATAHYRGPLAALAVIGGAIAAGIFACSSFAAAEAEAEAGAPDGGADAVEADAVKAAARFCAASDASFCVDFDNGVLDDNKWTNIEVSPVSTVSLDSKLASSGTYSMHAKVNGDSPGATDCDYARMHRLLSDFGKKTSAKLSFDVWLGPPDTDVDGGIALVGLGAIVVMDAGCELPFSLGTKECASALQFRGGADGGVYREGTLPVPLRARTWAHVDLDVSPGSPATMTYLVNGRPCPAPPIELPFKCRGPAILEIYVGLQCVDEAGVVEANFDNVEFHGE